MNPLIFVSSACTGQASIGDAVRQLAEDGFDHIELSGGTEYYDGLVDDLLNLKSRFGLTYRVHNYFPPPEQHFVLNLASMDRSVYDKSVAHCLTALDLCRRLGSGVYGVHAGYLVDLGIHEIGIGILNRPLENVALRRRRYVEAIRQLSHHAGEINLYVENNVISSASYAAFGGNPLMLCDLASYQNLRQRISFRLLLDIGHLHVSATTLGRKFEDECAVLLAETDYIHVSDNDGTSDANEPLRENSPIASVLRNTDLRNKVITLEINADPESLRESYEMIHGFAGN